MADNLPATQFSTAICMNSLPYLNPIERKLQEVQETQLSMITTLMAENAVLQDIPQFMTLFAIIKQIPEYLAKISKLRNEMRLINQRVANLKRRALIVQDKKTKASLRSATIRDKQNSRERELLAAQMATKKEPPK